VTEFFLKRPHFAGVLSFVILLVGFACIPILPIAQYPQISPPTVTVTAQYPGADAESVERAVTSPLEVNINGAEGMQYMQSYSTSSGTSTITVTFALGTDPTIDQTNVQHGVDLTLAQLPNAVQQTGVTVQKSSGSITLAIAMTSTSKNVSLLDVANYANLNVVPELQRIPGVGQVLVLGNRIYGMRVWVDPHKLQANNISIDQVIDAIQQQNSDVAPGAIGQPPTDGSQPIQIPISVNGRLETPEQFKQIVLAAQPNGGYLRLGDVARVELGAQSYQTLAHYQGKPAVLLAIEQESTANAIGLSNDVHARMASLAKTFPTGMNYIVAYDTTDFVRESIREVIFTLIMAIILVMITIFVFLQSFRSALIPAITIPVSLIGGFAMMKLLQFSINTLTLFGLTLATGLVVDDAIVVLENIVRHIKTDNVNAFEATKRAMNEIGGAVVATSLVLMSVFIPVGFLPGTVGQLYQQFALTIAGTIAISLFTALTLAPVLTYHMAQSQRASTNALLLWFNGRIEALRSWYESILPRIIARRGLVIGIFVVALALLGLLFRITPKGFIPDEDQSLLYVIVTLPTNASIDRTTAVVSQIESMLRKMPQVDQVSAGIGFGFATSSVNQATIFVELKPLGERKGPENSALDLQYTLYTQFRKMPGFTALPVNPPAIPGLGATGGFQFEIEDRNNLGLPALNRTGTTILADARNSAKLTQVRIPTPLTGPYLVANFNRAKALAYGITPGSFFDTLDATTGASLINFFNYGVRSYNVYVQADAANRKTLDDLSKIYVANGNGAMMPVSEFLTTSVQTANVAVMHYQMYRAYEVDGSNSSQASSGQALIEMQTIAQRHLPVGMTYEWTGIALQQLQSGPQTIAVFGLGLLLTFLVLVALYESMVTPFVIMLSVPVALLGAVGAIYLRRLFTVLDLIVRSKLAGHTVPLYLPANDVYASIGFVMLIGLAAKNAILIVEFADQLREQGLSAVDAVTKAAATRLRPILMTSFAFMLGILPLAFASGSGANARISLGTAVLGGMLISTVLNLAIVPVLYVVFVTFGKRKGAGRQTISPIHEPAPSRPPDLTPT
jgi:hydrophobic/amphiphilic exporter-1 (mainly G- bacteria), HAE1 family